MPLSEHEQRLLEQMERALYAEDPKFASALRGADLRSHYRRRILQASVGFILGIALLVTGVVVGSGSVPLSLVGFVLMLGAAFFALSSWRAIPGTREGGAPPPAAAPPASGRRQRRTRRPNSSGGFMERLEERWNRRRDENGR